MLLTRKSAKKVAASGQNRPETQKIPHSEEQGNDLESLDFPGKISAWRIKQERCPSVSQMAQSQQIQGIQAVEMFVSGAIKNGLLPTCCLRIAAQGCAGQQAGSFFFCLQ